MKVTCYTALLKFAIHLIRCLLYVRCHITMRIRPRSPLEHAIDALLHELELDRPKDAPRNAPHPHAQQMHNLKRLFTNLRHPKKDNSLPDHHLQRLLGSDWIANNRRHRPSVRQIEELLSKRRHSVLVHDPVDPRLKRAYAKGSHSIEELLNGHAVFLSHAWKCSTEQYYYVVKELKAYPGAVVYDVSIPAAAKLVGAREQRLARVIRSRIELSRVVGVLFDASGIPESPWVRLEIELTRVLCPF